MMRKAGHIILLIMFLMSTMGVVINKHYTHGELYDTAFYMEAESCCEVPGPCCEDTMELLRLEVDFMVDAPEQLEAKTFGIDLFGIEFHIFEEPCTAIDKGFCYNNLDFIIPKSPPNRLAVLQTYLL
ncbi:MAG: hypothetical protein JEZ03_14885 [Bacteroidales bacterium]|nr:hypothetical protein [Bacteroidales bacterium]